MNEILELQGLETDDPAARLLGLSSLFSITCCIQKP